MKHSTMRSLRGALAVMIAIALAVTAFAPQSNALAPKAKPPKLPGMVYTASSQNFDDTWSALTAALAANPNLRTFDPIDHAAAAQSVGLHLDPNRVIFFGNPNIGTPLMQANQKAGIDLPQKIHVIESHGTVYVGFNDATFLAARHHLDGQPSLDTIAGALRNLTEAATGPDQRSRTKNANRFSARDGLVTVQSDADMDTTWNRLINAIDASPANIAFKIDHQANAANAGLELAPTRLVVFGNPNLGTPIMQSRPTAGIDLPLKILVWEDEKGQVNVTSNQPGLLRTKHGVKADLSAVQGAIDNFLRVASEG